MPRVNELPSTLAPLVRRNAVEINPITFDTTRLIAAVQQTLAEEQARREADVQVQQQADVQARQQADVQARQQAEERARQQAEERAQQRAEDQNRRQIGRPPHALVWSWVLLVGLVGAAVIGYVLWGGRRSAELRCRALARSHHDCAAGGRVGVATATSPDGRDINASGG